MAERHPAEYDGIALLFPVSDRTSLHIRFMFEKALLFPGGHFTDEQISKISEEIVKQNRNNEGEPENSSKPYLKYPERAKVDYIVSEGLTNIRHDLSHEEIEERVAKALLDVGLLPEFASRFPHEFSGGQRQRIGIARCLVMDPEFIIADEPISALDVSIRAQVLNLMSKLQQERGLTYLFIAHDLSVMRFICDRIAVIHKGVIVELAETEELFKYPLHPYTRVLLSAVPVPNPHVEQKKKVLVYDPSCHNYSANERPMWLEIAPGHFVRGSERELTAYREKLAKR